MLYPIFMYQATRAVYSWGHQNIFTPFAVGLAVVLIDIPFDIIGIKFIFWSWHDTDPNIADRHYWVPWTSYYFHATFTASYYFWFHFFRKIICPKTTGTDIWETSSCAIKELICTIMAALLGMPGGVLMFIPFYHPLHDVFQIHSEVIVFIFLSCCLVLVFSTQDKVKEPKMIKSCWNILLIFHLVLHFGTMLGYVLFGNPEYSVSIGIHEPTGPCEEMEDVQTALGYVLQKRKYLCINDYNEEYYDFHCLPGGRVPSDYISFYTICGMPFENRAEYILILAAITFIAFITFSTFYKKVMFAKVQPTLLKGILKSKKQN